MAPPFALPRVPPFALPRVPPLTLPGCPHLALPRFPPLTLPGYPHLMLPRFPPLALPGCPHLALPRFPPLTLPGYPHLMLPRFPPLALPGCPHLALPRVPPLALPKYPRVPISSFRFTSSGRCYTWMDGFSHRDRNPLAMKQHIKLGGTSTTPAGSNAFKNTAAQKRTVLKTARQDLQDALAAHWVEVSEKCVKLAAELKLPLKDVEAAFRGGSQKKSKRKDSMFRALVWDKGVEMNEGQGERLLLPALQRLVKEEEEASPKSKEDKEKIFQAFLQMKEAKDKGTRVSNREAAKDVTWVVDKVYNEARVVAVESVETVLVNMESCTGARAILIVAGSSVSDTITPTVLGTDNSFNFVSSVLKMSQTQLASNSVRIKCVAMIQDGLRLITKKPNLMMEYINYEEKIRHALGVELVGLPPNFVMQAPSKLGSGGSDIIRQLLTRLKANTCKWQPVSTGDKAELAVKFANAKKKPRKIRSDKKARDDDAEEDKEEAPKKKNRKGSVKKGKDGGSSGKKSGGKRKRVEEEEEEEAPKRKKKKAKTAAADDDTSPPPSTKSKKKGASKPAAAKPAKTAKTKTPASRKRHTPEPDPDAEIINNSADDDEPAPKKHKSGHTTEPAKAQEAQDDTAAATAAATKRALEALMARRKVVQADREAAENGVQKSKAPRPDLIIIPKPKALARIVDSDSSSDSDDA
ncbi:hypothetical protein DFH09DRAFT_1319625 [Mycena vulgaris]|nr:hypothetical protein DFH09DRAFT_1319625 [Mycena vulgaris]